jgi:excisionase family DNA binding protein
MTAYDRPPAPPNFLEIPWYAEPDDLIGDWCVMTTPGPPSGGEGFAIASFLNGDAARHIADLHNATLQFLELSTSEAALLLGISRVTVARMCKNGVLPFRLVGTSHRRIPKHAVLEYRAKNTPSLEGQQ